MRFFALAVTAAALTATSTAAEAQQRGWRYLGGQTVSGGSDRDTIRVNSDRTFRELRVCVQRAPIAMDSFTVSFRNGNREEVQLRNRFRPGTCSRNIDLRGEARHITRIDMRYEQLRPNARTPIVTISGR